MDQGPLVSEQIDAGARFLGEFQKYAPVQAAFWLKESDTGEWYLYVASDQITDDNFDVAYGEVLRIADAMADPWFDPFQVKLINVNDPQAMSVLAIQPRHPRRIATRIHGHAINGLPFEEVYIYPSPIPVPVP